jgi:hypothetical protein
MAKARNGFWQLAEKVEAGFLAPFILGVARSAQAVVRDLQEQGPSWTGEFANSWEIASSGKISSGTGAAGAPQRLLAPILTPQEFKFKPEVKYYISNKAPHADVALDIAPYIPEPDKDVDFGSPLQGKKRRYGFRPEGGRRGELNGSGFNSASAPLDWYARYVQAGKMDKTISLYMDQAMRNVKL